MGAAFLTGAPGRLTRCLQAAVGSGKWSALRRRYGTGLRSFAHELRWAVHFKARRVAHVFLSATTPEAAAPRISARKRIVPSSKAMRPCSSRAIGLLPKSAEVVPRARAGHLFSATKRTLISLSAL